MRNTIIFFTICLSISLLSCNKWDKVEPIPGYIHINHFNLTTNYLTQGTSSNRITDVWCYSNGKLLGVFELPATIPILEKDSGVIILRPGVFRDGLSSTRTEYTFYNPYIHTRTIVAGKIDTVAPTVTYRESSLFVWREDFEQLGATWRKSDLSDTTFIVVSDTNRFEGFGSMGIFLDETHKFGRVESIDAFSLDNTGRQVYLEMNFKTDDKFVLALQAESPTNGVTLLNRFVSLPTGNNWKKVYLHLTPLLNQVYPDSKFRIVIYAQKTEGKTSSYYYFDNFKLIQ